MIKTAVILAGGCGSRLKLVEKPKGFLNVAGKPLIYYSIQALLAHGLEKIIIGTGFKAEFYERLADDYPQIIVRKNEEYLHTGSLKTLSCLQSLINEDFLLLESDILYDQHCLSKLIKAPQPNVLLMAKSTNLKDAVWVEVDKNHDLVRMSKEIQFLRNPCDGILVGITKISFDAFQHLMNIAEEILAVHPNQHYDFAFESLSDKFFVLQYQDLIFTEIDDDADLNYALTQVYPKLTFC